jgi:hypothetical protein
MLIEQAHGGNPFQKRREYVLRHVESSSDYCEMSLVTAADHYVLGRSYKNLPTRLLLHRGQAGVCRPWQTRLAEIDSTANRFAKHRRTLFLNVLKTISGVNLQSPAY